jgi:hypothetical protein
MDRILRKPDNRAAAVETLCHIMTQAESKLAAGDAKVDTLRSLLAGIDGIADGRWASQAGFLRSRLGPLIDGAAPPTPAAAAPSVPVPVPVPMPMPMPVPVAAPPPQQAGGMPPVPIPVPVSMQLPPTAELRATSSINIGTGAIYSICYDSTRQELISAGKDMPMAVWGSDGQMLQQ